MTAQTIQALEPPPSDATPLTDPAWRDWFNDVWEAIGSNGTGTFPKIQIGKAVFSTSNEFQNLLGSDHGLYVQFSSTIAQHIYGFVCDVKRAVGARPVYGARLRSWTEKSVTGDQWGAAADAISRPGSNNTNTALEGACTILNDSTQKAKTGASLIFKDRLDGATAAGNGLGTNRYNYYSRAVVFSSQARSSSAEFCGWNVGLDFIDYWGDAESVPAYNAAVTYLPGQCVSSGGVVWKAITTSLNQAPAAASAFWVQRTVGTTANLAVGIDFSSMSTGANARMASAIRLRELQVLHWEETGQIGTFYNATTGILHLVSAAGTSKFSVGGSTGNVTFAGDMTSSGTGKRFKADFSNATRANRFMFQDSTTNNATNVGVIANGAGAGGTYTAYSGSDPDNAHALQISCGAATTVLNSTKFGTGTQRELEFQIGGATKHRIDINGNNILGTSAALGTTATDGFTYLPSCAGAPTGVPTAVTGMVPTVIDTTNSKLYCYIGGAWKSVLLA
jgi:hypothetical protein